MGEAARPQKLVVIGASSGGIEALRAVLEGLPDDFPAAVVIAQHLDPRRPSHLQEILQGRTPLVERSVEGTMPLETGAIHVVPANNDVSITDHSVSVQVGGNRRPKPSIDSLLASAAKTFGEQLIAVILTGEGSDGAEGAREVKEAGGTVVIQDPRTASHPSMPLSLAPTSVDIVAPLDEIGRVLSDLVLEPIGVLTDDERLLERFLGRVRDQTGIDFRTYKRPTIARRLQRRMAAVGARSLRAYTDYVNRNPDEYGRLASTFLIKVTQFFRDADLFDHLRDHVVPEIIRGSQSRDREIRVWSAGCATGEEAYSLAILFAEVLGDEIRQYNVRIFATDLDGEAVNFARRGLYGRSSVSSMPAALVDRYFTRVGGQFEIRKQIRALTVFGQHDLGQRAPFPRIDLAVARNVLIYFTPELQKRALQLFAFSLREGGYLVLGKAESVSQLADLFTVENPRLKVYRRQGERVLIPPSRTRWVADGGERPWQQSPRAALFGAQAGARSARDQRPTLAERAETILLRLPMGVVLVDRDYDIQLINGAARRLLGIHGSAVGDDFVHIADQLPSPMLREGIDGALAGADSTILHEIDGPGGTGLTLRLTFQPHRIEGRADDHGGAVVLIEDLTDAAARDRDQAGGIEALTAQVAAAERRAESLAATNRDLLAANQELTLANAELRSANDELLVGSEEVQAATEEVETLNEELQATNEELETLNEELQATIEELNTTNDDLEARSADVAQAAGQRETEARSAESLAARLASRLLDADIAMLVVGADGKETLVTDRWRSLTEAKALIPQDRTPPLLGEGDVAGRVLSGDTVDGRYVLMEGKRRRRLAIHGEPLRDEESRIVGALLVLRPEDRRTKG